MSLATRAALRVSSRLTTLASHQPATSTSLIARLHSSPASRAQVKDPQLGDYPQVPPENLQNRRYDPRWWDPQEKRNFGETLHEQDDVLGVWAPDVHKIEAGVALRRFLMAAAVMASFASVVYLSFPGKPAHPRQYPRDGLLAELGGVEGTAAPVEGAFNKEEGGEDDEEEEED